MIPSELTRPKTRISCVCAWKCWMRCAAHVTSAMCRSLVFSSKLSQILSEAGSQVPAPKWSSLKPSQSVLCATSPFLSQGGMAPGQLLSFDAAVRVLRNIRPSPQDTSIMRSCAVLRTLTCLDCSCR